MPPRALRTPRLLIRPLSEEDREGFVRFHQVSFDALSRWSPTLTRDTDLGARFEQGLAKAPGEHLKLVGVLDSGHLGALISLNEIVRGVFQNAYAGWAVSSDVAGQGLATEAVTALMDLAFAPPPFGIGLHRVQANIIPANGASLRVAEKVGLRQEGLARAYLKIAGQWQDHLMFARVAEEHAFTFLDAGAWAAGGGR